MSVNVAVLSNKELWLNNKGKVPPSILIDPVSLEICDLPKNCSDNLASLTGALVAAVQQRAPSLLPAGSLSDLALQVIVRHDPVSVKCRYIHEEEPVSSLLVDGQTFLLFCDMSTVALQLLAKLTAENIANGSLKQEMFSLRFYVLVCRVFSAFQIKASP